jgi:hypothetical protein
MPQHVGMGVQPDAGGQAGEGPAGVVGVDCATDGDRLHPGLGALLESFIGRLAAQAAMGAVVVVEVSHSRSLSLKTLVSSITTPSSSW